MRSYTQEAFLLIITLYLMSLFVLHFTVYCFSLNLSVGNIDKCMGDGERFAATSSFRYIDL